MKDLLKVVLRHWRPLLGLNLIIWSTTAINLKFAPKTWKASAEIILPNTSGQLNTKLGSLGDLKTESPTFTQQVNPLKILSLILMSDEVIRPTLEEDPEKSSYHNIDSYKALFKAIPQSESTIIGLSAEAPSMDLAERRLNALIEKLQQRLEELRNNNVKDRSSFFDKELRRSDQRLSQARKALADFKRDANLVSSEEQVSEAIKSINTLRNLQAEVIAQAHARFSEVNSLSTRLGLTPQEAIQSLRLSENKDYLSLRTQLSQVNSELIKVRSIYTDQAEKVRALADQRTNLLSQIEYYISQVSASNKIINNEAGAVSASLLQRLVLAESESQALNQQNISLQQEIEAIKQNLSSLPEKQARLAQLSQAYQVAEAAYNGFAAKQQEARLSAASTYPIIQILSDPSADPRPAGSTKKLALAGALLASISGTLALLLFLESRDPLLNNRDIEVLNFQVLGGIPRLKPSNLSAGITLGNIKEFQRLAVSISMLRLQGNRIMISSAISGEGKTTLSLGLAGALTSLGFNVLLIDGDLLKPDLSRCLEVYGARMYNNRTSEDLTNEIYPPHRLITFSVSPKLDLLMMPPQPKDAFEFVAHGEFEKKIAVAQKDKNYDYILIDGSSLSATSESILMAQAAENILLTIRPGISKSKFLNESMHQLKRQKVNVMGLVINGRDLTLDATPNNTLMDIARA